MCTYSLLDKTSLSMTSWDEGLRDWSCQQQLGLNKYNNKTRNVDTNTVKT